MLKLTDITKDYIVASNKVHALRGISISFRSNEFVSILGPSGCGKTTLLNIIGGLDHYTSGDLVIDNISTKDYTDRDWDTYRNHRIGFIFQSYNLIPHQTVLENVELALTISGMQKEERVKKAKEALDKVGLQGEYDKKPNQLSGGQCQRVAIARALVNEPDILLADEPTGALDTKTSIQIMDLIKEISEDRLVIMVTHNPEIADKYSTRIVTLLDGLITSDSNPIKEETKEVEPTSENIKQPTIKKSKLSFWSAFKLSARNLRSKFKRTAMVCIAGSIGIVGVASVLSLSTGVRSYISDMQEDMLSGNPIRITEEAMNLDLLMETSTQSMKQNAVKQSIKDGVINVDSVIERLISSKNNFESLRISNDITEDYIQFIHDMPESYYSSITSYYGIDVANNIYTDIEVQNDAENAYVTTKRNLSLGAIINMYTAMMEQTDLGPYSGYIATLSDSFNQAVENEKFIAEQYDIISSKEKSKIATEEDEIMIVVSDDSELTDLLLAQLGYFSQNEFFDIIYEAIDSPLKELCPSKPSFTYDELLNKKFTYYPNSVVYTEKTPANPLMPFDYNYESTDSMQSAKLDLKITAILRPKKGTSYGCLQSGIYYTPKFTKKFLQDNKESRVVKYLEENELTSYTSLKSSLGFTPMPSTTGATTVSPAMIYTYDYYFVPNGKITATAAVGNTNAMSALLSMMMAGSSSSSNQSQYLTYSLTNRELGGIDKPNAISIYPKDFTLKDSVTNYLKKWNKETDITLSTGKTLTFEERDEITYSDNLSVVIAIINEMINIITIALVVFTALSLVVSTVMIAIITYVSVIERIKEIGVIRSLGGRKKDVSRLFTAESFIIGGLAGVIGIAITFLLTVICNAIVSHLAPIAQIAKLTISISLIMIAVSIVLTLISGLIPARIASKKDPVDALRTE